MARPTPETFEPAKLVELAQSVVQSDRFPMLATIDGDQPRVRPVSPVRTDGFTIYVANLGAYHKTQEIAANPRVELAYMDEHHDQVRITGIGRGRRGPRHPARNLGFQPLLRQYLGTIDNPVLVVYRVNPGQVRYMKEWALDYHEVPLDWAEIFPPRMRTLLCDRSYFSMGNPGGGSGTPPRGASTPRDPGDHESCPSNVGTHSEKP